MLCRDCHRQVTRGAAFCGACGAPQAGAERAARARAGRRRAAPARRRRGDRPRRGGDAAARGPERLAPARAHLGERRRRPDRGRGLEPRDVRGRRAADGAAGAARRRADPDRRPGAGGRAAARHRRGGADDRRAGRARRSSSGAVGADVERPATQFGMRPRVRSGYALKRLDESEGGRRWVLRDLSRDGYLRLSDNDAQLFELLDGTRSLVDLIGEAEAALRRDRVRAARAPALRPRGARLPRRRRGLTGARRGAGVVLAPARHPAREDVHRAGRAVRRALPPRRAGCCSRGRRCG